ncbi:MAG: JAB domain-containing protein [Rikenellaceae bacterium]
MEIKDIVSDKIKFQGFSSLSDIELLSLLLGNGSVSENIIAKSQGLIDKYGNIETLLSLDILALGREKELSGKHAIVVSLFNEFSRRGYYLSDREIVIIRNTADVEKMFMPILSNLQHEEFWLLCLNGSRRVLDKVKLGHGGMDGVLVDVRIVMRHAINKLASSIILVHNHPSGSMEASDCDVEITKKIDAASKLLEIKFLEHVVITPAGAFTIEI